MVERETASARRAAITRVLIAECRGEPRSVSGDEGEILGEAVVEVARDPLPLGERRGLGYPGMDAAVGDHGCGEDQGARQRAQALAGADLSCG